VNLIIMLPNNLEFVIVMQSSALQFQFIGNACGVFIGKNGSKILCDPWLIDGVFDGSWCHFSKLSTTVSDFEDVDAIYLSHIHPDHFDDRNFLFDKAKPIVVLDHNQNYLLKRLATLGFKNLIAVKDQQTISFNEFNLTMFAPFEKSNFHEAKVGNLIDSAILVSCDGITALNTNDNMFSIQSAKLFKQKYGPLSLAMLNYNAAGPYPSCFDNLTESEKTLESKRIILRNLSHMLGVIRELQPSFVMPFAGAYVIGGKFSYRNKYLGTSTWDECGDFLKSNGIKPERIVLLRESDTFDIENGRSEKPYQIIDTSEIEEYVERTLSKVAYPYESDVFPDEEQLYLDIESSSFELIRRMRRLELASTFAVIVKVFNRRLQIYPEFKVFENEERPKRVLECSLDERLLRRILDKKSHWNNAEIGTHISFYRSPNEYEYDLHTALQFFHLP